MDKTLTTTLILTLTEP